MDIGGCAIPRSCSIITILNKTVTWLCCANIRPCQRRSINEIRQSSALFQQASWPDGRWLHGIRVAPLPMCWLPPAIRSGESLALAAVASPRDMVAVRSPTCTACLRVVESLRLKRWRFPQPAHRHVHQRHWSQPFRPIRLKAIGGGAGCRCYAGRYMPDEKPDSWPCAQYGATLIGTTHHGLLSKGCQ